MNRFLRTGLTILLSGVFVLSIAGCGGIAGNLPGEVTVLLPDGTTQTVTLGAGVPSLANSTWQFSQSFSAGQTVVFLTISFGAQGNLERFDGNTIAPEIFGDTILFDGMRHSTNQPGLSYTAGTYGAETSDAMGFTFEGRLTAFAAGLVAANAKAIASGVFDSEDPNTMSGTFSITTEVTITSIPEANVNETFPFVARRIQ